MKRHATTIILLVLAVGLGVWLWLDKNRVTEGERQARDNAVFVAWRREDVARLEIVHEGETLVLVRDAAGDKPWRMTSPRTERVDQAAAERLLTTLEFASIVRKVSDEKSARTDDHTLGLDAPRATGSVTMGTLTFRFTLGAPSPRPEGSSYFRVDDRVPFVASKELTDALLASSDTYRDRTVVPYLSLELARFEVKRPNGGFAVDRKDERSFVVQSGVLASRRALDKVWGAMAEMRAETFLKDADADWLTATPRLTIVMTPKAAGAPPGELVIGDTCPGHPEDVVVLRKSPTRVLACAPRGAMEALEAIEPDALVDRRPFAFRHDEIEELRLEAEGASADGGRGLRILELARRGNGFHQREPEDRELSPAEADAANELLARIEDSTADSVAPGGGPFAPAFRARVRSGDHDEIVEVGDLSSNTVVLRRLRDDARLVVSRAVARRLVPRTTSTRPRVLLGDARRLTRLVLRCGTPQELQDRGRGLELVEPRGYETDGSITQLVDAIVRGDTLLWVADADDGSFGLSPDACHVVLGFGDDSVTVRLGAPGEGGVYGAVDGRPGVFVAPLAVGELAKRIYVSHASLRVAPDRIESVKVTATGRPVVNDPARLRDAAGVLFADRVVSLGAPEVGKVDIEIAITETEGGPPKRIVCGAAVTDAAGTWRRCATSNVNAVFGVRSSLVDALVRAAAPDAGLDAAR